MKNIAAGKIVDEKAAFLRAGIIKQGNADITDIVVDYVAENKAFTPSLCGSSVS